MEDYESQMSSEDTLSLAKWTLWNPHTDANVSAIGFYIDSGEEVILNREQVLHLISKLEQWAQGVEE